MARAQDIPEFGTLSGIKVVVSAVSTAGPLVGNLMAESGADVILLEVPKGVDPLRWANRGWGAECERRNVRTISLDVINPKGRDIFLKIIEDADIFIEASRGQQWDQWGYTDETLWEVNENLIIAHMSGYGETGLESYVKRPGYDHTIQAYSGMLELQGYPNLDPPLATKFPTDYYTALFTFSAVLSAYIKRLRTGGGESIECAQFEASLRCQAPLVGLYLMEGLQQVPIGAHDNTVAGCGYYRCKDGKGIYAIIIGPGVLKRAIPLLGLEYGSDMFPAGSPNVPIDADGAEVFEQALIKFFSERTAAEAEEELLALDIPCSRSLTYDEVVDDPHVKARQSLIEWENVHGDMVKGVRPYPRFKNSPQIIWRGCPSVGMDNEDILADIGIVDEEQIQALYEDKVIQQMDYIRG
ncbi:CoA transferase [Eggerthella sp. YY7918]|uniref:CoA transferase n=1 Tax=Eggerthella sp. (strain YY7918) TaxID=502558 RepID=UPI00021714FD|nr:CoA transferase [Eggerthella sp. YY7918]BAK44925.1 predicted acyl-CoA transferase [Eggerthella sp. YY7918]